MAETKGVKIKFEADDSKLQSSLRGIENESKKLQKSLKEIDRLLELDPSNTTLLTQKQELLAKSIENTSKQLQAMESAQDKISAGYANWQKNKEAIEANKEAIEALRRKQSELTEKSKEAQKAFEAGLIPKETLNETHKAVGDVINQIRALKAEQDKLKGEEGLVSEDVYQKYITDTERLRINLQNLNKQQEQLNANLQGADSAADGAAKAVDEQALAALPLSGVDVVIVAIGENFGASIRVVALLKQQKVAHIYARAIDNVHRSVLEAFGLERILTPEEDAARGLVHLLEFGSNMETFRVDTDYYVVKFAVPEKMIGYYANELNLDKEFSLKLLALKRAKTLKNCLGISFTEHDVMNELPENDQVQAGDELVCYGRYKDFQKFWKAM